MRYGLGFIGRRLCGALLTLALVSLAVFAAFTRIPGDSAMALRGIEASGEQLAALQEELGLRRSFWEQYRSWLGKLLSGRLGNSIGFQGASISALILDRLPVTLCLAGLSLVCVLLIAGALIPLAIQKEGSPADRIINTLTAFPISLPAFFLGILFIWVFGILFKCFTPGAYVGYQEDFSAFLAYLSFPALAVALPNAAILIKFLRASIFKEFSAGYVRTAYSKGNSRFRAFYRHVLKNAAVPGITLLGMIAAELFSGSMVIEQVFAIPGIGRLLIAGVAARDYPLVETLAVYIAAAVILANALADMLIGLIDPRIRR
ncbi:MAG: ABC transporter permease [Treponema sp.]|jgi:peptide/nickel transport system permease protein|nr:ABC transporter permease [Treponema sp.]